MFYLHGLVVNTENGTLCLNSSVMWSARGGLVKNIYIYTFIYVYIYVKTNTQSQ